jgi:hypothetical protein
MSIIGSVSTSAAADASATGSITANGQTVVLNLGNGQSACDIFLAGTYSAGTTITFEKTIDGTNWTGLFVWDPGTSSVITSKAGGAAFSGRSNCSGYPSVRIRSTAFQGGDNVAVTWKGSTGVGGVVFDSMLPAGTNVIGHVIADSGSTTAVTALPAIPAGSNVIGHVIADSGSTTAVTAMPVTHAIVDSGTVSAVTAISNALPAGSNVIGHVIADSGSTTVVTGTSTVAGGKTNNNAAPGATNVGVITGLANAAQPSWSEGNQVLQSMDLAGNQRVVEPGLTSVISGTVTCASTATQFGSVAAKKITVTNPSSVAVYIGASGVTAANTSVCIGQTASCPGTALNDVQVNNANLLYCIVASSTQVISWIGTN